MRIITKEILERYKQYLINEEKSHSTITKYIHDITEFSMWLAEKNVEKSDVLAYKTRLIEAYVPNSVNSVLSALNNFFIYMEWYDLKVKNLKIQKQIFLQTDRELTKGEYERLLRVAKEKQNERLYLLI